MEQLLVLLVIGAVAGWLAGLITKGGGFGLIGNIIVGILGAVFGGWLFGVLGISVGGQWLGPIVTATAGAVVLLFILSFIRKK
ncbi:MAG: GlsB/YeaQ/YmgE family stress response membrane protein [Puniceicoccaceae bacterium]|nr:MAG: GlsB/YeaQ/YmgE family stress response membrane protein [Puniceicoccaceae bacterium]